MLAATRVDGPVWATPVTTAYEHPKGVCARDAAFSTGPSLGLLIFDNHHANRRHVPFSANTHSFVGKMRFPSSSFPFANERGKFSGLTWVLADLFQGNPSAKRVEIGFASRNIKRDASTH